MISKELEATICRMYYAEYFRIGTIARELGVHRDTVKRALNRSSLTFKAKTPKDTLLMHYEEYIHAVLREYPKLKATRLLQMLKERGYEGSVYPVRNFLSLHRPRPRRAYQDLSFFPGEYAQVDWGSFGKLRVGGGERRLECFVMVLAYSRRIFAKMLHDEKLARVCEGHALAFEYFGGVPRHIMYDNMKTVVTENVSGMIRFNEGFSELSRHYCFKPKVCTPRSGWEKGRVERSIRYIRDSFFAAREFSSLLDLNTQLRAWLDTVAVARPWQDDTSLSVAEAFSKEKLMETRMPGFDPYETVSVKSTKQCLVHFDCNRYSVPAECVSSPVTIRATHEVVKIHHTDKLVASHERCWGKRQTCFDPLHHAQIVSRQRISKNHSSRHRLAKLFPETGERLLKLWHEQGASLTLCARKLVKAADDYGQGFVADAIARSLESGSVHIDSILYLMWNNAPLDELKKTKLKFARKELSKLESESHDLSEYDN